MVLEVSLGRFYGIDSVIDSLIVVVALLISFQSWRIHALVREKNFKYFSAAFFLIGLSYLFKVFANVTSVHRVIIQDANFVVVILQQFGYMQLLYFITFTIHKALLVGGFLILFLIFTKTEKRETILVFFYLSFLAILLSIYYDAIFRLTLIVLLVALAVHFYRNHQRIRSTNSLLVFVAFSLIALSNVTGIFQSCYACYLINEIILLVGFSVLFANHVKIHNEQEKNKARGRARHARDIKNT